MKSLKELMNLKGRVALITGGAGHIGYAAAEALAEQGANIVLLDINKKLCDENAKRINKKYGVDTLSLAMDLANYRAIKFMPYSVRRKFRRLDIIVNCAAMLSFKDNSPKTWEKALRINLTAIAALIKVYEKDLVVSRHGSVINISSIYGLVGPDMRLYKGTGMSNSPIYSSSKGGLLQFTRWLATTLAPEIRVNAISPGGIWRKQSRAFNKRYTERTPLKRMATEDDLKGAIVYLASDLSSYVTGQNLVVDGGWTAW